MIIIVAFGLSSDRYKDGTEIQKYQMTETSPDSRITASVIFMMEALRCEFHKA